jgi:hypothetical protein
MENIEGGKRELETGKRKRRRKGKRDRERTKWKR